MIPKTLPRLPTCAVVGCVLLICGGATAEDFDPTTHIFVNGQLIGGRGIQIGDPSNWSTNVQGFAGASDGEKVFVSTDSFEAENDAIHVSWSKAKIKGQFAIYGPEVDLSPFVDEGALVLELKIDLLSRGPVMMGMDCQYPCRSERDVRDLLRKYPKQEWFTFAVPINCFTLNASAEKFDISKINGPLLFSTDGKMEMSIANVRLGLLPLGDPGCRES
jgi:beta-glucosidase